MAYARTLRAPLTEIVFIQVSPKVWSWDHYCSFSMWLNYHLSLAPPWPLDFLLMTVRSNKSLSGHVALQKDLESLYRWYETWGLKFIVSKCNIMHLSRKSVPPTRFYTLGGKVIISVSKSRYLGVIFSYDYWTHSSQWKSHISQSPSKTNQRLPFLHHNLRRSPYKLHELAYISLVRSTMEYCGAIWDTPISRRSAKGLR